MIPELVSNCISDIFWSLSWQVRVTTPRKGVMAWLWLMPSPEGRTG